MANELLCVFGPGGLSYQLDFINELFAFCFVFKDNVDWWDCAFIELELDEFYLGFFRNFGVLVRILYLFVLSQRCLLFHLHRWNINSNCLTFLPALVKRLHIQHFTHQLH